MNDSPLPANMAHWPQNPSELLGVGSVYGVRELKKAYSKLIRYYKPEHYPAEFARIREAYDRLLPWASNEPKTDKATEELPPPRESNASSNLNDSTTDITRLPEPNENWESPESNGEKPDRSSRGPSEHAEISESDLLWQQAGRGEIEAAHLGLVRQTMRNPTVEKNYLRLFWLVSVHPNLEEGRFPAHWLAAGFASTGGSQRLLEVYANYLSMVPEAASGERFAKILDNLQDLHQYSHLVQIAWRQLLKKRRWRDIQDQFPIVRERLISNLDAWLSLVRIVADTAGWELMSLTAIDLMKTCVSELKELNYLALQRPDVFDRVDFLRTLVKSSHDIGTIEGLGDLARIVQREWSTDLDEVRHDFHQLLAKMARFPNRWSNRFDDAGPSSHAIACQAYHLALQLRAGTSEDLMIPAGEEAQRSLGRLFKSISEYRFFRDQIAQFCFNTFFSPEALAELLGRRYARKFPQDVSLEEQVLADWPLRLICLAHRFYHS